MVRAWTFLNKCHWGWCFILRERGRRGRTRRRGGTELELGVCSLCWRWWWWAGGSERGAQVLRSGGVLRLRRQRSRWDRDKGTDLGVGDSVETGDEGGGNRNRRLAVKSWDKPHTSPLRTCMWTFFSHNHRNTHLIRVARVYSLESGGHLVSLMVTWAALGCMGHSDRPPGADCLCGLTEHRALHHACGREFTEPSKQPDELRNAVIPVWGRSKWQQQELKWWKRCLNPGGMTLSFNYYSFNEEEILMT